MVRMCLPTFNTGENLMMESRDNEAFGDKAGITTIFYVNEAANSS